LASALASRNTALIHSVASDAQAHLSEAAAKAAKAAAAIMGMNNIYYRFVHMMGVSDYAQLPARLRMNIIANPGVEKLDFEMWSLAVSAVNGCGMCVEAHERELIKHGTTKETIQDIIRIAAVIHAVAVTIETEATLAGVSREAIAAA
jgi:alkyl hydroperoxide reductase subunit D